MCTVTCYPVKFQSTDAGRVNKLRFYALTQTLVFITLDNCVDPEIHVENKRISVFEPDAGEKSVAHASISTGANRNITRVFFRQVEKEKSRFLLDLTE